MINITKADSGWLLRLLIITENIFEDYPELFTDEEEETLRIAAQLIRSIA